MFDISLSNSMDKTWTMSEGPTCQLDLITHQVLRNQHTQSNTLVSWTEPWESCRGKWLCKAPSKKTITQEPRQLS